MFPYRHLIHKHTDSPYISVGATIDPLSILWRYILHSSINRFLLLMTASSMLVRQSEIAQLDCTLNTSFLTLAIMTF
jgi:hypothetical protein